MRFALSSIHLFNGRQPWWCRRMRFWCSSLANHSSCSIPSSRFLYCLPTIYLYLSHSFLYSSATPPTSFYFFLSCPFMLFTFSRMPRWLRRDGEIIWQRRQWRVVPRRDPDQPGVWPQSVEASLPTGRDLLGLHPQQRFLADNPPNVNRAERDYQVRVLSKPTETHSTIWPSKACPGLQTVHHTRVLCVVCVFFQCLSSNSNDWPVRSCRRDVLCPECPARGQGSGRLGRWRPLSSIGPFSPFPTLCHFLSLHPSRFFHFGNNSFTKTKKKRKLSFCLICLCVPLILSPPRQIDFCVSPAHFTFLSLLLLFFLSLLFNLPVGTSFLFSNGLDDNPRPDPEVKPRTEFQFLLLYLSFVFSSPSHSPIPSFVFLKVYQKKTKNISTLPRSLSLLNIPLCNTTFFLVCNLSFFFFARAFSCVSCSMFAYSINKKKD